MIMFTYCRDDINLVKQLVKKFATLTFATNVGPNTSHVVTGEGKRTLNLLKGLLQGCWIVSKVKYCVVAQPALWSNGLTVYQVYHHHHPVLLFRYPRTGPSPHWRPTTG